MMAKKLCTGMLIGAAVGGALMMLDRDTRQATGEKSKAALTTCKGYIAEPSQAVHQLRLNYEYLSKQLNKGVEDLLKLLNKAEDIINRVGEINQEVEQQIRAIDTSEDAS
ncbi:YtxH domain-containing protein [Halobacillus fulvus]|nr:YtxH domain-containing protein [Halobacillus fulvus]